MKHSMFRPHERVVLDTGDVSMTRQEMASECDINAIMRRYEKTGVVSHVHRTPPKYGDFVGIPDFQESMNLLNAASAAFLALPARVRRDFDNDPVKFVEFVERPENLDKVREYGLADVPKAPDAPMKVEVVNSLPTTVAPGGALSGS